MNALYRSLNNGGVSMLESPTGTGKTLSIICSALQRMIDRREKEKSEKGVESDLNPEKGGAFDSDDEPDWMRNFAVKKEDQGQDKKVKKNKFRVAIGKNKPQRNHASCRDFSSGDMEKDCCRKKVGKNMTNGEEEMRGEDFLLDEYDSEEEGAIGDGKSKRKALGVSLSSSSDEEDEDGSNDEDEEEEEKLKAYFCRRTHSQLLQFIKELRKIVFANEMKVMCLGSRKNFCINEEVLKLGNTARINERCLALQKKKNDNISKIKNLGAGG